MNILLSLLTEVSARTMKRVQCKIKRLSEIRENQPITSPQHSPQPNSKGTKPVNEPPRLAYIPRSTVSRASLCRSPPCLTSQYVEVDNQLNYIINLEEELIKLNKKVTELQLQVDLQANFQDSTHEGHPPAIQMERCQLQKLFNHDQRLRCDVNISETFTNVILLIGERGVGKSHMIQEMIAGNTMRGLRTCPYQGMQGYTSNNTLYLEFQLEDSKVSVEYCLELMALFRVATQIYYLIEKLQGQVMRFLRQVAKHRLGKPFHVIHNNKGIVDYKSLIAYKQDLQQLNFITFADEITATDQLGLTHLFRFHGAKTISNMYIIKPILSSFMETLHSVHSSGEPRAMVHLLNLYSEIICQALKFAKIEVHTSIKRVDGANYLVTIKNKHQMNMYAVEQHMCTTYLTELLNPDLLEFQAFDQRYLRTHLDEDADMSLLAITCTMNITKIKKSSLRDKKLDLECQILDKRFNKILDITALIPVPTSKPLIVSSIELSGASLVVLGLQYC